MLNVAICDDELNCAKSFSLLLKKSFTINDYAINIISVTDKQEEIYELMKNNKIDLLFLDIDFKNSKTNGIEFSKKLRKINKDFYLVFLTAHSRYMPISFLSKTFDFITKPIHINVINNLVERFIEDYSSNKANFVHITKKLSVKTNSILYIEKTINKCELITTSEIYSCTTTLNNLISILPSNFIRCHKSYIVNRNNIEAIDKTNHTLILKKDKSIPYSKLMFKED